MGLLSKKWTVLLLVVSVILMAAVPTATYATPSAPTGVYRMGSRGSAVESIQSQLIDKGYLSGNADGIFGSKTHAAVIAFQTASKLVVDGICGKLTIEKLFASDPVSKPTEEAAVQKGTVTATSLNVRQKASITSAILGKLKKGTPVDIYQTSGEFYRIKYNSADAYVSTMYVTVAQGDPQPSEQPVTYNYTLKVGSKGTKVKDLQDRLKELGYFTADVNSTYDTVTRAAVMTFQKNNKLTVDGYAGPKTLTALFSSDAVSADAAEETPAEPVDTDTSGGNGNTDDTPALSLTVTQSTQTYYARNNNISLKKGSTGNNVKDLQTALKEKGYYCGSIDGIFGDDLLASVKKFQRAMGLTVDGIAGNYTLSAAYSCLGTVSSGQAAPGMYDTLPNVKSQKTTWSTVKSTIPVKSDITVVDVRTGISFRGKFVYGTLHMDTEPLTAEDAALFHACYSNTWSWNRRPVYVLYNGVKYAASMNGMPHGDDNISGNDYVGQFCIHFVGSKTHGSQKVDPAHQACIEEAYNADH